VSKFPSVQRRRSFTDSGIDGYLAPLFGRFAGAAGVLRATLRASPDTMREISDRVGDFAAFAEAPRSSVDTSLGFFSLVNRLSMTSSTWDAARRRPLHRFGNGSQLPSFEPE
jgi:hypothetical protein